MAGHNPQGQDIINCDMCSNPVEFHCNPCHVNLCVTCSPNHMRANLSKKHSVVLYKHRMLEPVHPECASHSDQKCQMFCSSCNTPICVKCVTTSHKTHNFVDIEKHIISTMKTIIEADNKELEDIIIPTYEGINSELKEKATSVHYEYEKVEKNIDQHGVKWHKEIDIVIQKQKQKAQIMKEENLNTLKNQQEKMQDMLSLALDVLKRNKNLLKISDVTQMKNYKSRNLELKTEPRITCTMTFPSFTPIRVYGEYLYRQFGKVSAAIESEIEKLKVQQFMMSEVDTCINLETKTKGLGKISYLPADKLWIHGIEETIFLIDIQGTVLDTVKTVSGEMPQGLTVTKDGHPIYGDYDTGNINMVKNGQTRTIITLPCGWIPYDMCFSLSDDLLIAMYRFDDPDCKVVRYNKHYKVIQEIQYDDEDAPLYPKGEAFMYITENKNTDICVSNDSAKNVITVNQSGKLRWRYTGNLTSHKYESFNPVGIATDSQCHVLVADAVNHCVHVIDQDGKFILYIEKLGINFPYALCVDEENRLFVGQSAKRGSRVAVLRYLK